MDTLPYQSDWDFCQSLFDPALFKLSLGQGRSRLAKLARRKNWRKYPSVRDFLFCELAGKFWAKQALNFYQGKGDFLLGLLSTEAIEGWHWTMLMASETLNSSLEFKSFSSFRRTVLLRALQNNNGRKV